jgi:hypothetical protein
VSIRRVAFVPSAPLLVPAVAAGSASLDEALRSASLDAVRVAIAGVPDQVLIVAAVAVTAEFPQGASWDFHGFGVPRGAGAGKSVLPWPLGIGAWLLDEAGWTRPRRYLGVAPDDPMGIAPPEADKDLAVIVVGDGSACRTEKAPGYLDERAAAFDADVVSCLASGDIAGLRAIDRGLAAELLCAGWAPWQWLSSAVEGGTVSEAELVTHIAPYGVAYLVANWVLAPG